MPALRDKTIIIHSKVSYGYVGSSTTALVLQIGRQDAITVPTVLYSNRLGLPTVGGGPTPTPLFASILEGILQLDILDEVSSIITGFIGSTKQVNIAADFIGKIKERYPSITYLCDPVMGDVGGLYVPPDVPEVVVNRLVPLADVLTPNYFELQLLTGRSYDTLADMEAHLRENGLFAGQQLVGTSCQFGDTPAGYIDIVSYANRQIGLKRIERVAVDPPGTGELFAAHLHLQMLHGTDFQTAIERSASTMHGVLTKIKAENRREMALPDILHSIDLAAR